MDDTLPPVEVPGFEVLEQLASGGLAEIYLARDESRGGELVALKLLREEDIDSAEKVGAFLDEVEVSTRLIHPTIVRVFHGEFVYGVPYLVMEYVDGITVYELMERAREAGRQIPLGAAAYVAAMVADALEYAHTLAGPDGEPLHLVHRDVSAVNVMITLDGAVKLVDFGIARSTIKVQQTAPGIIKGKLPYMSPEQCSGKPIDALTDVYSLGVLLYEMVCLERPYPGEHPGEVFAKVIHGKRKKMHALRAEVSPRLEGIVDRAMASKRSARYGSAGAMLKDLRAYMERSSDRPTSSALAALLADLAPRELARVQDSYGPPDITEEASIDVVAGALGHRDDRTPTAPQPFSEPEVLEIPSSRDITIEREPTTKRRHQRGGEEAPAGKRRRATSAALLFVLFITVAFALGMAIVWATR